MSKERRSNRYDYHRIYGKKRRKDPVHKSIRKEYHKSEKYKKSVRNSILKKKYGISFEEYNDLFNSQNGCCAICRNHQSNFKRALSVDHDHNSGEIRGLLCHKCNVMLGLIKDNIETLSFAIKYLNK